MKDKRRSDKRTHLNKLKMIFSVLFSFFLFACTDSVKHEERLKFYRERMRFYSGLNKNSNLAFENAVRGNPAAMPYYRLVCALNKCLENFVDTSFSGTEEKAISSRFEQFNKRYHGIFDSVNLANHRLFLNEDFFFVRNIKFEFQPVFPGENTLNLFLNYEKAVQQHQAVIRLSFPETSNDRLRW